jgi:hypothetical protein
MKQLDPDALRSLLRRRIASHLARCHPLAMFRPVTARRGRCSTGHIMVLRHRLRRRGGVVWDVRLYQEGYRPGATTGRAVFVQKFRSEADATRLFKKIRKGAIPPELRKHRN